MALSGSPGVLPAVIVPMNEVGTPTPSSSLSVTSTTPASSSILDSSPTTLLVSFDRSIDDFTVGNNDFEVVHVAADGTTSPLSPGEAQISESLDSSDPTNSRIALSLSKPLLTGHYQLLLVGNNQLQGLDGTSVAITSSNLVLSDFTIGQPSAGLSSATDLQTIGTTVVTEPGTLDLASDPAAVQYYKFTLAPGHHWQVGLEIAAHRDGGTLDSSLSLFDSQGQLISSANVGLLNDPSDPYLFAGLNPGTYYVGIAAKKNIPNAQGVYNPSLDRIDSSGSGGPFQLSLVADPADQPVQLIGLRVDHADPLSSNPTGLTLQFSGGIDVADLQNPSQPALTLVDNYGKTWSLLPTGYDLSTGQLSLAFNQTLPTGTYTLELSGLSGLVDLAGDAPVASGFLPGALGSIRVTAATLAPGDLGAILPGAATSGLDANVTVVAGTSSVEQFEVVVPGIYTFGGISSSSGLTYSVRDASGNLVGTGPNPSTGGSIDLFLSGGSYKVAFNSTMVQPAHATLTIQRKDVLLSSFIETGVSQGPALSLRLTNPQADFGQSTGVSTSIGSIASPVTNNDPTSTGVTNAPVVGISNPSGTGRDQASAMAVTVGQVTPTGPSVAGALLYGTVPVGRNASQSNPISVVGPSGSSGAPAIALNSAGLPAGLMVVPVSIAGGGLAGSNGSPIDPEELADAVAPIRRGVTLEAGLLARAPSSRLADDQTLANADWIRQLVSNGMGWLEGLPIESPPVVAEPALVVAELSSQGHEEPVEGSQSSQTSLASLTSPFGVGIVLAAIAYHYRQNIPRRASDRSKVKAKAVAKPIMAGPHYRTYARVR